MKDSVQVTIVDARDYVDWSIASARCCVRPQEAETTPYIFPLDKVAEHVVGATFHQGKATSVSRTGVQLENGETIDGDCISSWPLAVITEIIPSGNPRQT